MLANWCVSAIRSIYPHIRTTRQLLKELWLLAVKLWKLIPLLPMVVMLGLPVTLVHPQQPQIWLLAQGLLLMLFCCPLQWVKLPAHVKHSFTQSCLRITTFSVSKNHSRFQTMIVALLRWVVILSCVKQTRNF